MLTKKNIAVLGSTGSIGTQTLDIISAYPELFQASVLTAGRNARLLVEQAQKYRPEMVVIGDPNQYTFVKAALLPYGIDVAAGDEALCEAAAFPGVDTVLTATTGYSGLAPTISAISAGKDIALANKETLVVAGGLITELLKSSKSQIHPVDSEHSAIYQCLVGEDVESVEKLIITASGGPFRKLSRQQLESVGVEDALRHPNWSMGAKITIDSATMMNKAFEIIEARWLFGIPVEKIEAVVHPQSIIHSMVQFVDGAVKAQLGLPDMHLPIRYALGQTKRLSTNDTPMRLADYCNLTFERPDTDKFPCLTLAQKAMEQGGTTACIINAANEIAVGAFLSGNLRFVDIYPLIDSTLNEIAVIHKPTYNDFVETNSQAREVATNLIKKFKI